MRYSHHAGYSVNAKAIPIFHSLFFPIYEMVKGHCQSRSMPRWQEYLFATTLAGGVCSFVTNPIWVVRTRIMVEALHPSDRRYNSTSITKIMRKMVAEVRII